MARALTGTVMLAVLTSSCAHGIHSDPRCEIGAGVTLGATVNGPGFDGSPTVSADETELLFTSDRGGQQDIFVATRARRTDPWSAPVNAGPLVNDPAADDFSLRLSNDGLTLYFASLRRGGFGTADIYIVARPSRDQAWAEARNAGPVINSPAFEAFPTPDADETTLYFNRSTTFDSDDSDIWMASRAKRTDSWQAPSPTTNLNSDRAEFSPSISADGRTMYFASARRGSVEMWRSMRRRGAREWTAIEPLGATVNAPRSLTLAPFISRDQHSLYFMAARSEGDDVCTPATCFTRLDLYVAPVTCQ